jgi:hypothetical protein
MSPVSFSIVAVLYNGLSSGFLNHFFYFLFQINIFSLPVIFYYRIKISSWFEQKNYIFSDNIHLYIHQNFCLIMKKLPLLFIGVIFFTTGFSQFIYKIKADSLLVTNDSDTCNAELNLENGTRNIKGFLYNKGNGRTEFRKGLIKLYDSLYIIGSDTLDIAKGTSAVPISKLLSAIGSNIINNNNYSQQWQWNGLAGGSGLKLSSNSTAASTNLQRLLDIQLSGANAVSGQTTVAGYLSNTHTGATSTNVALEAIASGGISNLAGRFTGDVLVKGATTMNGTFTTIAGSVGYKSLNLIPVYNQTGTATGNVYGIYYNPTLTSVLGIHYAWYNATGNAYWGNTGSGRKAMRYYEDYSTNGEALLITTSGVGSISPAFIGVRVNPTHTNSGGLTAFRADMPTLAYSNGRNTGFLITGAASNSATYRGIDITLTSTGNNVYGISYGGIYNLSADLNTLYGSRITAARSGTAASANNVYGYYADVTIPTSTLGTGAAYAFYAAAGKNYFADNVLIGTATDNGNKLQVTGNAYINGKQSIGTTANNALLHLGGGTATANTAPLKFTAGTALTTPENGAVEYDGTNYFVTSNETRYALARTLTTTFALNFNSTSAGSSTDLTITLTGAANGDPVSLGVPNEAVSGNGLFSAWVSASNTVTVRFSNNDLTSAIDPASGTFRVSIIKY